MKTATASLFLLFIFTITQASYLFGVTNATNDPVLDIDGEELRTGIEYYVVSAIWGAGGGGLALGRPSGKPCPEAVVQRSSDLDYGIPVIFSNANTDDGIVHLSTDMNIEFVPIRPKLCITTTVWKLDDYDESTGKWWLTTNGVKGNPGPDTVTNWFKISKARGLGYKFRFCPSVCDTCKTLCSDIGRDLYTDGQIRLALTSDQGWPFVFIKAQRTARGIHQVVKA